MENIFSIALSEDIRSIALPAIGTGVFKFPKRLCAKIMKEKISEYATSKVERIRFCLSDAETYAIFNTECKVDSGAVNLIGLR